MGIKRLTVYETKGLKFDTLLQALAYRENLVENFLRELPGFNDIPLSKRIAFVQKVLNNRKELVELLDYEVPKEEDDDS